MVRTRRVWEQHRERKFIGTGNVCERMLHKKSYRVALVFFFCSSLTKLEVELSLAQNIEQKHIYFISLVNVDLSLYPVQRAL